MARWHCLAVGGLALGCGRPETTPAPLVLLVSFDTTRADALSCYGLGGLPAADTPHSDSLAERGVRFAWAISSSSTTLAAHTAVMSGEDSHRHAVPRNGFPVPPELPLLAERFQADGWRTLASVGSFALERDMGLDRGFDAYVDHANWQAALFGEYEANGRTVTDTALSLVDTRAADEPVFLFVHYYAPHMPWNSAPTHVQERFVDPNYDGPAGGDRAGIEHLTVATLQHTLSTADRAHGQALYRAEVAWADRQLGRLLRGLGARGLLHDSLLVLFSDHGEMFNEEPARPYRHGPDVDLPVVHVPLIVAGSGRFDTPQGHVVDRTVRTLDIGTTVLRALDDSAPPLGTGLDLAQLWAPTPPTKWPIALAEATMPHDALRTDTWPNADLERAAVSDSHVLTRAAWLDHEERLFTRNPVAVPVQAAVPAPLSQALDAFDARMPGVREAALDDQTRSALEALGYIEK